MCLQPIPMCWDIETKFHKNLNNRRNDQGSSLQRSLKVLFLCRFRCNQHTITIPFTRKQSQWRYRKNRYKHVWWVKIPTRFGSSQTVWVFPLWRWPILKKIVLKASECFDQLETVSQFMACDICLEASVFTGRKFPPHSWRVWGCGDEVSGKHCHVYCMLLDFIPTLQRSIVVGA